MSPLGLASVPAAAILGAALLGSAEAPASANLLAAKLDVASASARQNSVALTAWKMRDPDLFMSIVPRDFSLKRPDGSVVTWQTLYENTKARMAAVKHVDRFGLTISLTICH